MTAVRTKHCRVHAVIKHDNYRNLKGRYPKKEYDTGQIVNRKITFRWNIKVGAIEETGRSPFSNTWKTFPSIFTLRLPQPYFWMWEFYNPQQFICYMRRKLEILIYLFLLQENVQSLNFFRSSYRKNFRIFLNNKSIFSHYNTSNIDFYKETFLLIWL